MDATFDLVMITELFDESLVLMKYHLGLSTDQILYIKLYERQQYIKHDTYLQEATNKLTDIKLRQHLNADDRIYQHFFNKLKNKMLEFGLEKMSSEVKEIQKLNTQLITSCIDRKLGMSVSSEGLYVPRKVVMSSWVLKKNAPKHCELFVRPEMTWIEQIRKLA